MKLTPTQNDLVKNNAVLPFILDKLSEIEAELQKDPPEDTKIEKIALRLATQMAKIQEGANGKDGTNGVDGKDGSDGKDGKDGAAGKDGKVGQQGPPGKDGKNGVDGINGKNGLDGSPDTADTIRNKLELLPEGEKLAIEAIEDLRKELDDLKKETSRVAALPRGVAPRSSNATKYFPLTPDGSTKTFAVPKNVACVVLGSDFPNVLMENAGFTINGNRTQIVLTVDNAPIQGSQLLFQYSSMFN